MSHSPFITTTTEALTERARSLLANLDSPRTARCLRPLRRGLTAALYELNESFADQYNVVSYPNDGSLTESDIVTSGLVVNARYRLRQRRQLQEPTDPYDIGPATDEDVLFTRILAGEFDVSAPGSTNTSIFLGVYFEAVRVEDALVAEGPALLSYYPIDSLAVRHDA